MKTIIYFSVIVLMSLSVIFTSCQKEEEILLEEKTSLTAPDHEDLDSITVTPVGDLKMSSSTILNASSASQIPSNFFRVASKYKYSYKHLKQPVSNGCSWTNYVMCTGAIANANGGNYPVNNSQVYKVRSRCGYSTSISALKNYARNYDGNETDYSLRATSQYSGRFQMIKYMLNHINTHHTPFVALAKDQSSGIGHYLTVWSINWKQGGSGSTIYYTNSLYPDAGYFNGNIKSVSFTTFLNWMRDNQSASYYNCLFLWED